MTPLEMGHAKVETTFVVFQFPRAETVPRPSLQVDTLSWLTCGHTGPCIASEPSAWLSLRVLVLKIEIGLPPLGNLLRQKARVVLVAAGQLPWEFYNRCRTVEKMVSLPYSRVGYSDRPMHITPDRYLSHCVPNRAACFRRAAFNVLLNRSTIPFHWG